MKIDTDFLDEYSKMISKYLWSKRLEGRDEYDNLYSLVVIKLMESVHKYDPKRAAISTWVTWVMRTTVSNYFRHKQQDAIHNALTISESYEEPYQETLLSILKYMDIVLTKVEQRLLLKHYHEGHSHKDLCRWLGKDENAIKVQIHRARQKIIAKVQGELRD